MYGVVHFLVCVCVCVCGGGGGHVCLCVFLSEKERLSLVQCKVDIPVFYHLQLALNLKKMSLPKYFNLLKTIQ
jgi:hypothetical protein